MSDAASADPADAADEPGDDAHMLRQAYGLDDDGLVARATVLEAVAAVAADGAPALDESQRSRVAAALADPKVALSVADAPSGPEPIDAGSLETVATAVAGVSADAAAGVAYVLARCAEHAGRAGDAAAHLDAALDADPMFVPALLESAWFAEDRGEARWAVTLLRRAGVDNDDAQLVRVQAWTQSPPAAHDVGRNDPCPCGSGRKFKRCCAGREDHPLEARAGWLLDKAETYAGRARHRSRLLPVVEARAGDPRDDERLVAAIRDPLIADLGLFDVGLLADFVAERSQLLPADEAELARSWQGVGRGCYEVVDADRGQGATLAAPGGERVTVWPGPDSRSLHAGETIFARVLPAADAHLLASAPVRVSPAQGERLLALLGDGADARCQAAWIAALEGAPALVTLEGEPTVLCQAVYDVADIAAVRRALAARFEVIDERRWVERIDVGGRPWSGGTLTLDGDRLTIEANAEARFEPLKVAVNSVVPAASLVAETRRGADEVLREG